MSDPLVLIPARLAATRLPRKPLADIAGEAMIVHVWRRAVEAGIGPVVVATDTDEIARAVEAVGGAPVLVPSAILADPDALAAWAEALGRPGPLALHR